MQNPNSHLLVACCSVVWIKKKNKYVRAQKFGQSAIVVSLNCKSRWGKSNRTKFESKFLVCLLKLCKWKENTHTYGLHKEKQKKLNKGESEAKTNYCANKHFGKIRPNDNTCGMKAVSTGGKKMMAICFHRDDRYLFTCVICKIELNLASIRTAECYICRKGPWFNVARSECDQDSY